MVIPILVWHGLIMLRISLNSFGEDAMKRQYLSIIISLIMLTLISCEGGSEGKKNSSAAPTELAFWEKTYGETGYDYAYSIQQTSDGGYIMAGIGIDFDRIDSDFLVLKLNSDGRIAWQKTYGGTKSDSASSIQQTSDEGYIVVGNTYSFGTGSGDFWILKLNSYGTVAWQKTYGGTSYDFANSIHQTSDGGYIVAGYTYSFGAGFCDFWVLKLLSDGTINFNSNSGASTTDTSATVSETSVTGADINITVTDTSITTTDIMLRVVDIYTTINQQAP